MWSSIVTGLVGSATLLVLGQAIDLVVPRRVKGTAHDKLTSYWVRLDDTVVPALPAALAKHGLRWVHRVVGPNLLGTRAIRRYLLASVAMTLCTVAAGLLFSELLSDWARALLSGLRDHPEATENQSATLNEAIGLLEHVRTIRFLVTHPRWLTYLLFWNALFDLTSVACTVSFLVGLVRYRAHPIVFVVLNFVVAVTCALGSLLAATFLAYETSSADSAAGADWGKSLVTFLVALLTGIPYSLSTLLPIAAFLAAMILALAAKSVLALSRRLGLSVLERATEDPADQAKPATILLCALWVAAIVVSIAWEAFWAAFFYLGGLLEGVPKSWLGTSPMFPRAVRG